MAFSRMPTISALSDALSSLAQLASCSCKTGGMRIWKWTTVSGIDEAPLLEWDRRTPDSSPKNPAPAASSTRALGHAFQLYPKTWRSLKQFPDNTQASPSVWPGGTGGPPDDPPECLGSGPEVRGGPVSCMGLPRYPAPLMRDPARAAPAT